ncbi:hypothetical protein KSP39_PZI016265 [Platanthera zijinensis]|uniref:Transposase (putative) gypsy type domain-containing protein n=1 Tax=Platanthera zijinensis TaxID=2320716 RepID=A0AAP0B7I2_9ASPA
MGKTNPDSDGRSKCAQHFTDYCFFERNTTEEFAAFYADFMPPGFEARRPREAEAINTFLLDELAFPFLHFEMGLRLPLWPEICQILKYFGAVPAQLNSNVIAMMAVFACFFHSERIELNLTVFRKLFTYKMTPVGIAYFGGSFIKDREIAKKHHNWMTMIIFIKGDLGNVPYSPQQKGEEDFEVAFLRRGLDSLLPVLPIEERGTQREKTHDNETHGTSDDIDESTPIDKVKGPNVFERAKEEIEALVEAVLPKKKQLEEHDK